MKRVNNRRERCWLRGLRAMVVVLAALVALSCRGPRIIPNDTLTQIFHDIYLTNAYVESDMSAVQIDSLNIYEPVFARYGYTSEDMQHTIGSFSKRKSSRLSDDVVDRAIEMLTAESRFWARRIAIHDTVGMIARERFAAVVYSDTLIRCRRTADTSRLRIVIPVQPREGSYEVSYRYFVDTLDHNGEIYSKAWVVDENGRRLGGLQRRLRRGEREAVDLSLAASEGSRRVVIELGRYPAEMTTPSLRVDTLVVKYLLPEALARDSMARGWLADPVLDSVMGRRGNEATKLR